MRQYQFEEQDLERLQEALKSIKNPIQIITRINRNRNGYTLTIEGNESDIDVFVEKLKEEGLLF